ncbi:MAG TPA: hypothetical protein VL156_10350 [Terriglobales bacterium]|jgi:hypothetical protein|nr:hypothetical protein [Terriglobales bacterium]
MNCVEFERGLPDCVDGSPSPEQQVHLNSCSACSGLLRDLSTIASQAKLLAAVDDPSPAVWNALEARLRSEGLIRRSEPNHLTLKPSIWQRWRGSWLVPAAAALAIIAGVKLYRPAGVGNDGPVAKPEPRASVQQTASKVKARVPLSHDDQQWLKTVANRPPAQLAKFQADLDQANSFIEDAQESLDRDPNDFYMQQMLINAYEQKQMLYELAVDNNGQ